MHIIHKRNREGGCGWALLHRDIHSSAASTWEASRDTAGEADVLQMPAVRELPWWRTAPQPEKAWRDGEAGGRLRLAMQLGWQLMPFYWKHLRPKRDYASQAGSEMHAGRQGDDTHFQIRPPTPRGRVRHARQKSKPL